MMIAVITEPNGKKETVCGINVQNSFQVKNLRFRQLLKTSLKLELIHFTKLEYLIYFLSFSCGGGAQNLLS